MKNGGDGEEGRREVRMQGGEWGRGGEREGEQTMSSGRRSLKITRNQVHPLCLSLCPPLHPSSLHSFLFPPSFHHPSPKAHHSLWSSIICVSDAVISSLLSPPHFSPPLTCPTVPPSAPPPRSIRPSLIVRLHQNPGGSFFLLFSGSDQTNAPNTQQREEEFQLGAEVEFKHLLFF